MNEHPRTTDPMKGMNANALRMSEAALMEGTRELARLLGWREYHTRDSRGSTPGFPDWIALRGQRMLVIEFKADRGELSEAQHEWLYAFRGFAGGIYGTSPAEMTVEVWTPADWITRAIHRELERR